jgi:lysophospholipase L1-like esterase
VVKQTESNYTLLEIKSISLTGTLIDPPAQKELYIEVIGDSLTCGMGNIGENSSPNPQTPIWEDATQSYGYMIAEDLDADYTIISQSGIGIAGSWFDPLFDFYTKASYSRYKKDNNYDEDNAFYLRTPDIIIINLGTNDYFLNKDKDPNMCKPEEVQKMTEKFIKHVRDCYGKDIPIVWAYGFVGTFLYDNIKGAIDKLGGEEEGIYMIEVPKNTGGAQGHPTVDGHRAAADTLLPLVKEILGIN